MRKIMILIGFLILSAGMVSLAVAKDWSPEERAVQNIDQIEQDCQNELQTYCKDVTPGGGRRLSCIYSHKEKLSQQCESALYGSAEELRNAAKDLNWFAVACKGDIEKLCSFAGISPDSITNCLDENKENVSDRCNELRRQRAQAK